MIDTKKLREIAKAATPGPWQCCNGYSGFGLIEGISKQNRVDVIVDDGTYDEHYYGVQKKTDATHIAAFNPTTALELLDRIDKLEEQLEHYKELSQELADSCNHVADERSAAVARIARLEAENRRLGDALSEISEWSDDPESVSIAREALNPGIKPEKG